MADPLLMTANVPMPWPLRLLRLVALICTATGALAYVPNLGLYIVDWTNGYRAAGDAAIVAREGLDLLLFAPLFAISVALSYGLLLERPWTRQLIVLGWALLIAIIAVDAFAANPAQRGQAITVSATLLPIAVATIWYLYRSESARAYYAALAASSSRVARSSA